MGALYPWPTAGRSAQNDPAGRPARRRRDDPQRDHRLPRSFAAHEICRGRAGRAGSERHARRVRAVHARRLRPANSCSWHFSTGDPRRARHRAALRTHHRKACIAISRVSRRGHAPRHEDRTRSERVSACSSGLRSMCSARLRRRPGTSRARASGRTRAQAVRGAAVWPGGTVAEMARAGVSASAAQWRTACRSRRRRRPPRSPRRDGRPRSGQQPDARQRALTAHDAGARRVPLRRDRSSNSAAATTSSRSCAWASCCPGPTRRNRAHGRRRAGSSRWRRAAGPARWGRPGRWAASSRVSAPMSCCGSARRHAGRVA